MKLPQEWWVNTYNDWRADDVIAFYTAAIDEVERESMPLLGASVDRRIFQDLARVVDSDSVKSLICFSCAQVRTYCRVWEKDGLSEIRYYKAAKLEELEARERDGGEKTFTRNFSLPFYIRSYGVPGFDRARREEPNFEEAVWQNFEWKRKFLFSDATKPAHEVLCCPEHVRRTNKCKRHGDTELCSNCEVPFCQDFRDVFTNSLIYSKLE